MPFRAQRFDRLTGGRLRLAQRRRLFVFLVVDRGVLLFRDAGKVFLRLAQGRGRRGMAEAHTGGGLVDQVDGLVRQMSAGDVADRQVDSRLHRFIRDRHLVVLLIALTDAHEDLDRLLERGLLDHDRLEAALQGRVALDVFAIFVESRRTDALQFSSRQRRLEDVGSIDGALCRPCPDEGMQLVDEQDRIVRVAQFLDDLLEPLLEFAAILRARNKGPDVEGQDALVQQRLRYIASDDPVRQTLRDRRLANARLTDERGVVLGPTRQDLDDPLDLLLAPDDGIQLAGPCRVGQIDPELVNGRRLAGSLDLRGGASGRALGQHANDLVADLVKVHTERLQNARGDPFTLADKAQEQVLCADVVMAKSTCLVDRQLDDPLGSRGQAHLADDRSITSTDDELDRGPNLRQLDIHILQHPSCHAFALADEAKEKMLRADVVVIEPLRFILRQG